MINLYRGIIDIFTRQARILEDKMTGHIRGTFDYDPEDNAYGSAGFWNLQAEICFILFVKLFVVIGIVFILVIIVMSIKKYSSREETTLSSTDSSSSGSV